MNINEWDKLRRTAERNKALYPAGTRIELIQMGSDPRPIESGIRGTVTAVDDIGTIFCNFDNGRSLGIISGEDSFRKLTQAEILDEQQSEADLEENKNGGMNIGW